jgi:hypothetical protein
MATLTRFDANVIAFETIADERVDSLILSGAGFFFAGLGFLLLVLEETWGRELLVFVPLALFGCALIGFAFVPLFRSEWLVVNLERRKYRCRRGVLLWGERIRGPLSDFNQIRLALVLDPGGHSYWAVEIVWRDDGHLPFRVHHWRWAQSVGLARPGDEDGQLSFLNDLKRMAKELDVQLVVPRDYCVNLGFLDVDEGATQ